MESNEKTKRYLVYIDILGFRDLPSEIAQKSGFDEDYVRQICLTQPFKEKTNELIDELTKTGALVGFSRGISEIEGSDCYILAIDNIANVFKVICELITIKIPHKKFECIPLEICIDVREITRDETIELINKKETIEFVSNDILTPYREYYKEKYGDKIKETFILLTESVFKELKSTDKKYCEGIKLKLKGKEEIIYLFETKAILRKCKMLEFLKIIGEDRRYSNIGDIYIPPKEYEEIKDILKRSKVVFITGPPGYGKTYTAVRLLWEFYCNGYEPLWYRGEEESDRKLGRDILVSIAELIKPRRIVYFEDPFGRVKYERRVDLELMITAILERLKQTDDFYVVITSREEIFKKFEKETLSPEELREFEKKLSIKRPSYNYKMRKEMLIKWAEYEDCKWLKNNELRDLVLQAMSDEKVLPTPLSIRLFAMMSQNISDKDELRNVLIKASQDVGLSLAHEIKELEDDKILFLFLLYLFENENLDFVREKYNQFSKSMPNYWSFDQMIDWFSTDKVIIYAVGEKQYIRYSHPSYSRILGQILDHKVVRNTLIELGRDCYWSKKILKILQEYFEEVPSDVRIKLMYILLSCEEVLHDLAFLISRKFDKIPDYARTEFLLRLSEKPEVVKAVIPLMIDKYHELPPSLRQIIHNKITEKSKPVEEIIAEKYEVLPKEIMDLVEEPKYVFVGNKPVMNYVLAVLTQFNVGAKEVVIKAKGRAISRAVDVAEIVRKRFLPDVDVKDIKIATEKVEIEEGEAHVSVLEITLALKNLKS